MLNYSSLRGVKQAAAIKAVSAKLPATVVRKASFAVVNSLQTLRLNEATLVEVLRTMRNERDDDTYNLQGILSDIRKVIGDVVKAIPDEVLKNELAFEETDLSRYRNGEAL